MPRLFFALWPDDAVRQRFAVAAEEVAMRGAGRAVPAAKLHLTLAFLGTVADARVAEALEVARHVSVPPFTARFDRIGSFPRAGVAWAGCSRPPEALDALAARLADGLRRASFGLEQRPFAAHVTLARRIRRGTEAPLAPAVDWRARELALVESDLRTGAYRTRGRWEVSEAR